jgi:hypothetical protein
VEAEHRPWEVIALALAASAVIWLAAAWLSSFSYDVSGGGVRGRIAAAAAQGATPLLAVVAVGASSLLYVLSRNSARTSRLMRQSRTLIVVATLVAAAESAYLVWYAITTGSDATSPPIHLWASRSGEIVEQIPTIGLCLIALALAVRPCIFTDERAKTPRERVPLRRRDWPDPWATGPSTPDHDRT